LSDKYEIARIVGKLNRDIEDREKLPTLLMGPGRWGTTTPSLGVPVKFAEINNVTILAEVAFPAGNLMPELSFGTHFFQDLVETNIFYIALFPGKKPARQSLAGGDVIFNDKFLKKETNLFAKLIPQSANHKNVIGVYDVSGKYLKIMSDITSQKIICFLDSKRISK